jgi:hypothetical protein
MLFTFPYSSSITLSLIIIMSYRANREFETESSFCVKVQYSTNVYDARIGMGVASFGFREGL